MAKESAMSMLDYSVQVPPKLILHPVSFLSHLLAAVATGWAMLGGGFSFISSLRLLFFSRSFSWIWSLGVVEVRAFRTAGAATDGLVVVLVCMIFATVTVCLVVVTGVVFVITMVVPRVGSWFIWFSTKVVVDGGCYRKNRKIITVCWKTQLKTLI